MDKVSVPKPSFQLNQITGVHTLLGAFLLVAEVLLGAWLFRAENPIERGFAGLLMVVLLGFFLWVVTQLEKEKPTDAPPKVHNQELRVAEKEATPEQIQSAIASEQNGPDGSYKLGSPPEGWLVEVQPFLKWATANIGVTDPARQEEFRASLAQFIDPDVPVLACKLPKDMLVFPVPGKTTIDGRKFPTAIETTIFTRLSIIPFSRARAPLFIERSLEHNFLSFAGQIVALGVISIYELERGTIPKSHRKYLQMKFRQKIENAIVNGQQGQNIQSNWTLIGIEGELQDHLLLMQYPTTDDKNPELERNIQTLLNFTNTFQPVKTIDYNARLAMIRQSADQNFSHLMAEQGPDLFYRELGFVIVYRLKDLDMNDAEDRLKAIRQLQPFRLWASEINLDDALMDSVWEALTEVEAGKDAANFKTLVAELIQIAENAPASDDEAESAEEGEIAELPPGDDDEDPAP